MSSSQVMPSSHTHRMLLLAGLLCLPATATRAENCATLQALALGDGLVVMLGEREAETSTPRSCISGCGSATPRLRLRWARGAGARWSQAGELPAGMSGVLFQHGKRPWTVRLPEPVRGRLRGISLAPFAPGSQTTQSEAPLEPITRAVAVATLDRWRFALVQQLSEGHLLIEELTSHGPDEVLERESALVVQTDWPEGSSLLGVSGEPGMLAVFARAPGGALLTVITQAETWRNGVPLDLPPEATAAGLWLEGGPAAFVAARGEISSWSLAGTAWLERGSTAAPSAPLWAATTFGPQGSRIGAVAWDGAALDAWTWQDGIWTEESVPPGTVGALIQPPAPEPRAVVSEVQRPPGVLIGLGLAAALLGAALSARLLRRR